MSCEHEQVEYRDVAVPMEFHGVNFGTAHVQVMICAYCGSVFAITEDGLRDLTPESIEEYRPEGGNDG